MKTTLEELRNNNFGYALGKDGITEADLRLINGIIDKIEQTRTRMPQPLDVVEYTDSFGCYYPNATIDGDTYRNGSTVLCECGSAYVSVSDEGTLCKSVSGGTFPVIDKNKLRYIGIVLDVFNARRGSTPRVVFQSGGFLFRVKFAREKIQTIYNQRLRLYLCAGLGQPHLRMRIQIHGRKRAVPALCIPYQRRSERISFALRGGRGTVL